MDSEIINSNFENDSLAETLPLLLEETRESIIESCEIYEKLSVVELIIEDKPIISEEQVSEDTTVEEVVAEDTTVEEVVAEETLVEEPVSEDALVEEHVSEDALVEEPVSEDALVEEPVSEETLVEDVVSEDTPVEEVVAEDTLVEEVVSEDTPVEEVVAEDTLVEEHVSEDALVEEHVSEDIVSEEVVSEEEVKNFYSLNSELEIAKSNSNHQQLIIADLSDKLCVATYVKPKPRIFISYAYFSSEQADHNLRFFIQRELLINNENIDYIFVINGYDCNDITFPERPNVTVLRRENIGYDFGGHKHALEHCHGKQYDYYFFMNSGVFGPIMPSYFTHEHWSNIFIRKINDRVKLVGTTIVCLPREDLGGYGPKIEGFFFLTDNVGLQLLKDEGTIFYDHPNFESDIVKGEYGLSNCILRHGYSLDCMIRKYQGIDWRDQNNWSLNNNKHPTRKNSFFGESLNPYELIFHKWLWKDSDRVQFDIVRQYVDTNT